MILPGPNDQQWIDSDQGVGPADTLPMGEIDVPANFLGHVDVDLYGKITNVETLEEGFWMAKLRMQIKRSANTGWVPITSFTAVPGHSAASGGAAAFGSAFTAVSGGNPSVFRVMLQGQAGFNASFHARFALSGAILD